MAPLQECPDGVVVFVGLGVVRVVPLHEVAETLGLAGDDVGEVVDACFALVHELADAVGLDLLFRLEALFFFDFDLDPETLSVVSVLKALAIALHVPEAEKEVFVGATPRMVDAHRVVGGYRTVDKGVVFLGVVVAREISVDESLAVGVGDVPTIEPLLLGFDEVDFGFR